MVIRKYLLINIGYFPLGLARQEYNLPRQFKTVIILHIVIISESTRSSNGHRRNPQTWLCREQ